MRETPTLSAVESPAFVSYAQNGEDVVLWRALHPVGVGTYVDVGANDPDRWSVTRAFYERGWRGINVEPMASYAALLRERRPDDVNIEAAVSGAAESVVLHAIDGTGLSTLRDDISDAHEAAGYHHHDVTVPARRLDDILAEHLEPAEPIHFLTIDVEGAERDVLETLDLSVWRPWVIVVESTEPLSPAQTDGLWRDLLLERGYDECLFDGLSRFYCAREQGHALASFLSYPACAIDAYATAEHMELREKLERTEQELLHWRAAALSRWSESVVSGGAVQNGHFLNVIDILQNEIESLRNSTSWRVTAPMRAVKTAQLRMRAGR